MKLLPVLVNPDRLLGMAKNLPEQTRCLLMTELGSLQPSDMVIRELEAIRYALEPYPALSAAWRVAMAEEILLLSSEGNPAQARAAKLFADTTVFGGIGLEDCLGKPCAVAMFPTAGDRRPPGVGHVWAIKGMEHRDMDADAKVIPLGFGLGVVASQPFQGDSWQVAAGLAARAVEDGQGLEVRRVLASEWIATGVLRRHRIESVGMGNKFGLDFRGKRAWLIPPDNAGEAGSARMGTRIEFPFDLDSAWAIVRGMGTQRGTEEESLWPERVSKLHILVGGQIQSAIASILYTLPEVPVTLWHSESSEAQAETIIEIMRRLRAKTKIVMQPISSSDLVGAEKALSLNVHASRGGDSVVLFNVTSGNRLMSYAVQSLAGRRLDMRLVYRDADANPHVFTLLNYGKRPIRASLVVSSSAMCKQLTEESWEWLYGYSRKEESKAEMLSRYLTNLEQGTGAP